MKNTLFKIRLNASKVIVSILDRAPFQEQIGRKILSLEESALSRKRPFSDLLIEALFSRQCYGKAADVYKKQKVSNTLYPSSLIKSLVRTDEVTFLGIELEKYLSETSLERSKSFHVYETAMASVNYPHEDRTRLRNERIIGLEIASKDQVTWQSVLITNGYLWKLEELDAQGLLAESVSNRIRKLKELQGDLLPYSRIAGLNNCTALPEKTIVNGGQCLAYKDLAGKCVVELNIPATFFFRQDDVHNRSVRRHLIEFYIHLIEYFRENKIPFMPILQFGWNASSLDKGNYVFSHHTRGGGDKHFHIKTSAIRGFVSLDKDGFAGWSSVAEKNLLWRERMDGISSALAEDTWKKAFNNIVVKNHSKYSQPELAGSAYTFEYIFLPLQIAGDLVASLSYITGYDLASFLVKKFSGSKYKVVIKRHPLCRNSETKELLEQLNKEDHVIVSNNSVHELIKNASLIATVNSGVGMEAILQLKNVVITGKADYFYGATLVKTIQELEEYLDADDWKKQNDVELKKFIHFYFNEFLINASSRDQVSARIRAIGL